MKAAEHFPTRYLETDFEIRKKGNSALSPTFSMTSRETEVFEKRGSNTKTFRSRLLCFVDRASLNNLFQMKPTRCALLLSIFISTSLHVSGNYVSIIRRT